MFGIHRKHALAGVAVAAGLLAGAGSASAGLDASVYEHNQTDRELLALSPQGRGSERFWLGSNDALGPAGVTDGTSNTIIFAAQLH
jgi:hypothetical protein